VSPIRNVKVGDLALLNDDRLPSISWHFVRVIEVHPGYDNIVRAVTFQRASGSQFQRPVVKIALLPSIDDEYEE